MEYRPLQIGDCMARIPLLQGGMGIGISLGNLAGAVAGEGAVGIISAAQIGFREPDFDQNPLEANLRGIQKEYAKARALSPCGVIGFNIMVAMEHYEAYVRAAAAAGSNLIVSGAGLPMDLPGYTEGSDTKLAPIVSSARAAKVLLKYWDRKYRQMPDLMIVEGPKAGGHLGFSREDLEKYETGYLSWVITDILNVIHAYEDRYAQKIPVALAGGIWDAQDAREAFAMGVDAIQVASRFVTTEECDADLRFKQAYLQAEKEDIILVKSPVGMPGRAIRNPFMEKIMKGQHEAVKKCHHCLHGCRPYEIPYCITDALIHAAKGETEEALLFCGANVWKADHMETVKEVIASVLPKVV